MRSVATCLLCGRPGPFAPLYGRAGYAMVRCPACRLVFQDPQPELADLADAYYFDSDFVDRLEGDLRPVVEARAREKLDLLERAAVPRRGRLLDVGCSTGAFLELAARAGWDATGVEIGDAPAAAARARGLEVHTGSLDDAALEGRFDLITFWDVLEHLPDPLDALRRARDLLAPGGLVAMAFPNVGGLYPRLTHRLLARTTGVWEHPELPVHLFDFDTRTAALMVREAGLRVAAAHTLAIPWEFLRTTTLHGQLGHSRARRMALMPVFSMLRALAYPLAALTDRGNSQLVLASLEARAPAAIVPA